MADLLNGIELSPSPHSWLTDDKLRKLRSDLGENKDLLSLSGLLPSAIKYWVKYNTAFDEDSPEASKIDENIDGVQGWKLQNKIAARYLSDEQIHKKILVQKHLNQFASKQWGGQIESAFIHNKELFDRAKFIAIISDSKDLMIELYHRIKNRELLIDNVEVLDSNTKVIKYGLDPVSQCPHGLERLVRTLAIDEVSKPTRMAQGFCLVALQEYQKADFSEKVQARIINLMLNQWLDWVTNHILEVLPASSC